MPHTVQRINVVWKAQVQRIFYDKVGNDYELVLTCIVLQLDLESHPCCLYSMSAKLNHHTDTWGAFHIYV